MVKGGTTAEREIFKTKKKNPKKTKHNVNACKQFKAMPLGMLLHLSMADYDVK